MSEERRFRLARCRSRQAFISKQSDIMSGSKCSPLRHVPKEVGAFIARATGERSGSSGAHGIWASASTKSAPCWIWTGQAAPHALRCGRLRAITLSTSARSLQTSRGWRRCCPKRLGNARPTLRQAILFSVGGIVVGRLRRAAAFALIGDTGVLWWSLRRLGRAGLQSVEWKDIEGCSRKNEDRLHILRIFPRQIHATGRCSSPVQVSRSRSGLMSGFGHGRAD